MYARPFRILRSSTLPEGTPLTVNYATREQRDARAQRFADRDGRDVLLEEWRDGDWWMTGAVKPSSRVTITLTRRQADALLSTLDSAQRGRDDFEYLVSCDGGDYSESDIRHARAWHKRERAVEKSIRRQLKPKH